MQETTNYGTFVMTLLLEMEKGEENIENLDESFVEKNMSKYNLSNLLKIDFPPKTICTFLTEQGGFSNAVKSLISSLSIERKKAGILLASQISLLNGTLKNNEISILSSIGSEVGLSPDECRALIQRTHTELLALNGTLAEKLVNLFGEERDAKRDKLISDFLHYKNKHV